MATHKVLLNDNTVGTINVATSMFAKACFEGQLKSATHYIRTDHSGTTYFYKWAFSEDVRDSTRPRLYVLTPGGCWILEALSDENAAQLTPLTTTFKGVC